MGSDFSKKKTHCKQQKTQGDQLLQSTRIIRKSVSIRIIRKSLSTRIIRRCVNT